MTPTDITNILSVAQQLREKDEAIKSLRSQRDRAWHKIEKLEELLAAWSKADA